MEVTGKIIAVLPESSGVSKSTNKPWKKREYVLETLEGQFPQKIAFNFFGDRADQYPLQLGQVIKLSFDINSREYNGRWYTDISGWKAEYVNNDNADPFPTPAPAPAANSYGTPVVPPTELEPSGPNDDLPF